eukprot:TRINITY_DN11573_c0_g1_i2.p1 TRINITY_DN11573_c0_g1~~TRINITY_DN11573_c0_g1_i2.p1  ORF type:complete len:167 (+),score=9.70 TRINITY_DN11573_c0_g1_i2:45-503(+)
MLCDIWGKCVINGNSSAFDAVLKDNRTLDDHLLCHWRYTRRAEVVKSQPARRLVRSLLYSDTMSVQHGEEIVLELAAMQLPKEAENNFATKFLSRDVRRVSPVFTSTFATCGSKASSRVESLHALLKDQLPLNRLQVNEIIPSIDALKFKTD